MRDLQGVKRKGICSYSAQSRPSISTMGYYVDWRFVTFLFLGGKKPAKIARTGGGGYASLHIDSIQQRYEKFKYGGFLLSSQYLWQLFRTHIYRFRTLCLQRGKKKGGKSPIKYKGLQ